MSIGDGGLRSDGGGVGGGGGEGGGEREGGGVVGGIVGENGFGGFLGGEEEGMVDGEKREERGGAGDLFSGSDFGSRRGVRSRRSLGGVDSLGNVSEGKGSIGVAEGEESDPRSRLSDYL